MKNQLLKRLLKLQPKKRLNSLDFYNKYPTQAVGYFLDKKLTRLIGGSRRSRRNISQPSLDGLGSALLTQRLGEAARGLLLRLGRTGHPLLRDLGVGRGEPLLALAEEVVLRDVGALGVDRTGEPLVEQADDLLGDGREVPVALQEEGVEVLTGRLEGGGLPPAVDAEVGDVLLQAVHHVADEPDEALALLVLLVGLQGGLTALAELGDLLLLEELGGGLALFGELDGVGDGVGGESGHDAPFRSSRGWWNVLLRLGDF